MKRIVSVALVVLAVLVTIAPSSAQDASYKEALIHKFGFYNVATRVFAPVYPALAKQLVQDYGITEGVCVDLGGAEGSLAIELAKVTKLTVYDLDINPAAVRLCNVLADEAGLTGRVRGVEGDAQNLPFKDNFADLVVSRNSLFEWPDMLAGFREAYRILRPGGVAYMGGGLSRLLDADSLARLTAWCAKKRAEKPDNWVKMDAGIPDKLHAMGIARVRVIEGPTEFDWWLEMRK